MNITVQEDNTHHRCSVCGLVAADDDLNGYDPLTGDFSKAYHRKMVECDTELYAHILSEMDYE